MAGVTRLGDMSTADPCGAPPRKNNEASENVFTNNLGTHRVGDSWVEHACPSSSPHSATTVSGSNSVFVNGKKIARISDTISCGSTISEGSHDVFSD